MINSINYEAAGGQVIEFDPSKLRYTKDGIPILSIAQIESVANEVLKTHCMSVFIQPSATPVAEILIKLKERTGLLFAMDDLGYVGTAKVLGKVSFHKKTLYLDNSLEHERKAAFRFTAAHEIGHWILHRYNYRNWKFAAHNPIDGMQDEENDLCRLDQRTPKDWLEFHANVFAASLITPRKMFLEALVKVQKRIGIIKNIGRIYWSEERFRSKDFANTVAELAGIFQVSKKSVEVRIKTLDLIC